jgi:hypothetical protein
MHQISRKILVGGILRKQRDEMRRRIFDVGAKE